MRMAVPLALQILTSGETRPDRTGTGTISLFGMQQRYNLAESFPAVTTKKLAWKRYIYATLGALIGGMGFIWALTNKKHLYLHDQILNNYFIDLRFYKSSSDRLKRR